jgi:hypothetical protein
MMAIFWNVALCSLALMLGAVSTSETSVISTRLQHPRSLYTCRLENLKSHAESLNLRTVKYQIAPDVEKKNLPVVCRSCV